MAADDVFGNAFDYAEGLSVFGNVFWYDAPRVDGVGFIYSCRKRPRVLWGRRMGVEAVNTFEKLVGEDPVTVLLDFSERLDDDETLEGTPEVSVASTGLLVQSPVVTTEDKTRDGVTIPAGKGIQVSISGGSARSSYWFKVLCGTSASDKAGMRCRVDVKG